MNGQKLVGTIEGFINPLSYQENYMLNLVTKAVMLEKIKHNIRLIEEVGVAKMKPFIQERIRKEQMNIWEPMHMFQLQTWSASLKMYM